MTECHSGWGACKAARWAAPLRFSSLGCKKIIADFRGGTVTSDAGGLLLREADRRLGLIDALADGLTDPRDPAKVVHEQRTMLAQRIFGIALGYEELIDHDTLRHDPLFSVLTEQPIDPEAPLASSPTLCWLENRIKEQQRGLFADRQPATGGGRRASGDVPLLQRLPRAGTLRRRSPPPFCVAVLRRLTSPRGACPAPT